MPNDTMTISLSGDVSIDRFAKLVRNFTRLISALHKEVGSGADIEWMVIGLDAASATATVQGKPVSADAMPIVERVVESYLDVGKALERQAPVPYSPKVQRPAKALSSLLQRQIDEILEFQTLSDDAVIRLQPSTTLPKVRTSYGAIKGRVQTLTSRGALRFTLYDLLLDKPVACYIDESRQELMRDIWGKLVIVEGKINRDPTTGRPLSVRQITNIRIMPEYMPGSYLEALGIVPIAETGLKPEDAIRQLRDA